MQAMPLLPNPTSSGMRLGVLALILATAFPGRATAQVLSASPGFDTTRVPPIYTATLPVGASFTLPGRVELDANGSASDIRLDVFLNQDVSFDAMSNYRTLFTFDN